MTQEAQPSKEAMEAAKSIMTALGISQQLYRGDGHKLAAIIDASHAGLREELNEERLAIEKIGEYLLPLVGTGDGTAVDAAKKAVSILIRLREELDAWKKASGGCESPTALDALLRASIEGSQTWQRLLAKAEAEIAELRGKNGRQL